MAAYRGGTSFKLVTSVKFGTKAATFTVNSATKITVKAPLYAKGTVDVRVTTSYGTSKITSHDKYTFTADPTAPGRKRFGLALIRNQRATHDVQTHVILGARPRIQTERQPDLRHRNPLTPTRLKHPHKVVTPMQHAFCTIRGGSSRIAMPAKAGLPDLEGLDVVASRASLACRGAVGGYWRDK